MSELDKVLDYLARDGYGTPIGVLESVAPARAELSALRAENAAMRKALEFYAHEPRYGWDNWRNDGSDPFTPDDEPYLIGTSRDRGRIARTALGGSDE